VARRNLLDVIGQVYDAAQDERLWSPIAPKIACALNSNSTVLYLQDTRLGEGRFISVTPNFDQRAMEDYNAYYGPLDVWRRRAEAIGPRVVVSKELIADADFDRTEIRNDYFRHRADIFYTVGAVLKVADDPGGFLAVHRPHKNGDYFEQEREQVIEFLPHLIRALQIRHRLNQDTIERQSGLETLERTKIATIVVTRNGALIHFNRAAEAMLRAGDTIRSVSGQLATASKPATEQLALLIRQAAGTAAGREKSSGGAVSILASGRMPVTVLVAHFRPAKDGAGAPIPAAILFIRDPERSTAPGIDALKGLFGLTPAEATVASQLAQGRSISSIGAKHRLSNNTVRTHLKGIFAKTDVRRQGELVALVLRSVATITR
jgi:DNA-binding CsgD family transcriptional regulator